MKSHSTDPFDLPLTGAFNVTNAPAEPRNNPIRVDMLERDLEAAARSRPQPGGPVSDTKDIDKRIRAVKAKIKKLLDEQTELKNERMRLRTGWMVGEPAIWAGDGMMNKGERPVVIAGAGAFGNWVRVSFQRLGEHYERQQQARVKDLRRPTP